MNGLRIALLSLWLGACCFSGDGLGSLVPSPAASGTLHYTPDPSLVNWGATYDARQLADGNPATYWCAPSGTPFPIATTLSLDGPSQLTSIDFDNRVLGYETSGLREITIEPLGVAGAPLGAPVQAVLNANAITTVPVSAAGVTAIRLTFTSNYGGGYAVLSELTLRSDMGVGLPPAPAVAGLAPPPVIPPSAPFPPPFPTAAPVAPATGLSYVTDAISSTPGFEASQMHDGNPATYWCSEANPYFPYVMTLTFSPSTVSAIEIDSTNAAYPTIGPRDVTILTMSPLGGILNVTNGYAEPNAITRIPLVAPVTAAQVRVTLQNNHGGVFAGISELRVLP